MLFKLAFRNFRRSLRDYAIYFVTLTMAVLIFQMFRTATSQDAFELLMDNDYLQILNISEIMQIVSWFMLAVLGFLIVYANRFMLKRRSREIGTYIILGIKPGRLALLLGLEVSMINVFATLSGLILGTLSAQWLSILILRGYDLPTANYRFVFSPSASAATLFSFIGITAAVLLLIAGQLSRLQVADLLRPARKQQVSGKMKPWHYAIIFLAAIFCLGSAYALTANIPDARHFDTHITRAIVLGIAGTYLLTLSLTGGIILAAQTMKKRYYKGLTFFTLRNISTRIHSYWVSLATISLLIFFTLTVLLAFFSAISHSEPQTSVFNTTELYDLQYVKSRTFDEDISPDNRLALKERTVSRYRDDLEAELSPLEETGTYNMESHDVLLYHPIPSAEFLGFSRLTENSDTYEILDWSSRFDLQVLTGGYGYYFLSLMTHDEAARIMDDYGEAWDHDPAESILFAHPTATHVSGLLADIQSEDLGITLAETEARPRQNLQFDEYIADESYWPIIGSANRFLAVIPDDTLAAVNPDMFAMDAVVTTADDVTLEDLEHVRELLLQTEAPYSRQFTAFGSTDINYRHTLAVETQEQMLNSLIGIYFSINFMLTASTILSLQYLSELSDNRRRYRLAGHLGAAPRVLKRQIVKETATYFLVPLVIALVSFIFSFRLIADPNFFFPSYLVVQNLIPTLTLVIGFLGLYLVLTSWTAVRLVLDRET